MAIKPPRGGIQIVTHTNQLRPSRGPLAMLYAEDGDSMLLTYDAGEGRWYGDCRSYADYFGEGVSGYITPNYQGNDASMTTYLTTAPDDANLFVNEAALTDGWMNDYILAGRSIKNVEDTRLALKKWVKAGLYLEGRVTSSYIAETAAEADTLSLGFGMSSWDESAIDVSGSLFIQPFYHKLAWNDIDVRGVVESFGSLPASFIQSGRRRHNWVTYNDFVPRVYPTNLTSMVQAADQSSYTSEIIAQFNGQVLLLAVLTVREDGTTPTTPTITTSDFTWVQVAETAFDTTGNMRAKLTVFRTQCDTDNYYGSITIDYGGVTQGGVQAVLVGLHNENHGGTNGSAAVAQSATGTSASDADVSASLSAFANTDSILIGFVGMTRDADYPAINAVTGWSDILFYDGLDTGAYFSMLAAAVLFDEDTTPSMDLLSHDAAGMVAIEIAAATLMTEPYIGDYGNPAICGYKAAAGEYTIIPSNLEIRYVA